jgi:hypothetical protein
MKYKIDYTDSSWLFFTPFVFLNMGGTDHWTIMSKKHWWNKWKKVGYTYDNPEDTYIEYFKLKYNLDIQKRMQFTHNKDKNKKVWCDLEFKFNSHSKDYKYCVGYKPINYARFYYCAYSSESYEDALMKLWCDLEIKKLIHKI